jgi:actin-related protein 6
VLDETFVMNACKEDCCYVALDWAEDVRIAKRKGAENTLARDYVLPGMIHSTRRFIRSFQANDFNLNYYAV